MTREAFCSDLTERQAVNMGTQARTALAGLLRRSGRREGAGSHFGVGEREKVLRASEGSRVAWQQEPGDSGLRAWAWTAKISSCEKIGKEPIWIGSKVTSYRW